MSLQCQKIEIKKLPFYASDITNFTSAVCAVVLGMSGIGEEPLFESWAATYSGDLYDTFTTVTTYSSIWQQTDYVKLSGDVMTGGLSAPSLSTNNLYVAGSTINFFDGTGNVIQTLKSSDVGNFKSNYTLTNSRSANWQNTYSTVSSYSAIWGSGSGLTIFSEISSKTSPNNTIPTFGLSARSLSANVDFAIIPKGEGALLAQIPDGSYVGGDKRGAYATDWQRVRNDAFQVASGQNSTIGGGVSNNASGQNSTIGGGVSNNAGGINSTIAGGNVNIASSNATVGGGTNNFAEGEWTSIGGGASNIASGNYSTIAGGNVNNAINEGATIGGGRENIATGGYSTIGGGQGLSATGGNSTVGGGQTNIASEGYSTIGGGASNSASGQSSTIGGGESNITSGINSTVGGGSFNTASGDYSTIAGGSNNIASGLNSFIAGGASNNTNNQSDTFILGSNIIAPSANYTYVNNLSSQGDIRASSVIYSASGNSNQWNITYTTVRTNSSTNWNYQGTDIKSLTSNWQNTYSTVQSSSGSWNAAGRYLPLSGGTLTGTLNVSGANTLRSSLDNTKIAFTQVDNASLVTTLDKDELIFRLGSDYITGRFNRSQLSLLINNIIESFYTNITPGEVRLQSVYGNNSTDGLLYPSKLTFSYSDSETPYTKTVNLNSNVYSQGENTTVDVYLPITNGTLITEPRPDSVSWGWPDAMFFRDEANAIAQRNSFNAQTFRVYNIYTNASNYERGFFRWRGSQFSASISGTLLTLTVAPVGTFTLGQRITGTSVTAGTIILSQASGLLGAVGSTYNINISQTRTARTMYSFSDVFEIGTERVALGTSARPISFLTNGVERLNIGATGEITTTNTLSTTNVIYASGGNSNQWNSTYSTVQSNSASWNPAGSYLPIGGGTLTGPLGITDGGDQSSSLTQGSLAFYDANNPSQSCNLSINGISVANDTISTSITPGNISITKDGITTTSDQWNNAYTNATISLISSIWS